MGRSTTALLAKIERQDEAKRQAAWAERRSPPPPGTRSRPSKWAADFLLDTGQITPGQHDAALRLHLCIVAARELPHLPSNGLTAVHSAWDLSVATEVDRVARLWKVAQSREIARTARSWVEASPYSTKPRMRLYDHFFALPCPSWKAFRNAHKRDTLPTRVSAMLDVLCAFWDTVDAGYGPRMTRPASAMRVVA